MHMRYRGLVVNEPGRYGDLAQLLALGGGGFGGLPGDYRTWIAQNQGGNAGETEALVTNNDGLQKISNFSQRWSDAVALSGEVDQLRDDPASGNLISKESGLASALTSGLLDARTYYPWCNRPWNRGDRCQTGLDAALNRLDTYLTRYVNEVGSLVLAVRRDIDAREAAKRQAAIDEQTRIDAVAVAQRKVAEEQIAIKSASIATAKQEQIQAESDYEQLQRKISAPKVFGVPLSVVVPAVLAGGIGLFFIAHKRAAPLAGYRRRRRS